MENIVSLVLLTFLVCFVGLPASYSPVLATGAGNDSTISEEPPSIKYCALLGGADRYVGKEVRLSASWKFGFETSYLFDRKCSGRPPAWLEFAEDGQSCPESRVNRKIPGPHDNEADVTAVGKLYGPGRYGHLGAYEYKFVVTCLEKIKVTSSDLK
jgi:hypothetical protein